MVVLHVKRAEESQFLYSCLVTDNVESVLLKVTLPTVTNMLLMIHYFRL